MPQTVPGGALAVTLVVSTVCAGNCARSDLFDYQRDQLDALYPANTPRVEILNRARAQVYGNLGDLKSVAAQAADANTFDVRYVGACIHDIKKRIGRTPTFYDRFRLRRGFWGLGIWQDYVFYDEDLNVIGAYRRLLD